MQTCTGPIMYDTQRRGGREGESVDGNGGWRELLFCILVRERRKGKMQETGVNRNEKKKRPLCFTD